MQLPEDLENTPFNATHKNWKNSQERKEAENKTAPPEQNLSKLWYNDSQFLALIY